MLDEFYARAKVERVSRSLFAQLRRNCCDCAAFVETTFGYISVGVATTNAISTVTFVFQ